MQDSLQAGPARGGTLSILRRAAGGWRDKVGPLWWHTAVIFCAARVGDLFNLYVGAFFLPAVLPPEDLGAVDPVVRLAAFGGWPLGVIGLTAAMYLSAYRARGQEGKIKLFLRDMSLLAVGSAALSVLVLLALAEPIVRVRLGLQHRHIVWGICGLAVVTSWQPLMRVVLQGLQHFYTSAFVNVLEVALKVVLAVLLVPALRLTGWLYALSIAGALAVAVAFARVRWGLSREAGRVSYYSDLRGMLAYAWPVAVWTGILTLQGFVEPFVVKHFLSAEDAAGFYMVCRFGLIPMYLVGAVQFVLFPLLSHKHERGEATGGYLGQALAITAVVALAGTVLLGALAGRIFALRADWRVYAVYAPHVWRVGLMATADACIAIYLTHETACRRFGFLRVTAPVAVLSLVILYGLFGWAAFAHRLPESIWSAVNDSVPRTLAAAIGIMLAARIAAAGGLWLQWRQAAWRMRKQ